MGKKAQQPNPVTLPEDTVVVPDLNEKIDPAVEQAVLDAYDHALIKLILGKEAQMRFFATLVTRLRPAVANWVPTAGTDGRSIYMNPSFWMNLSLEERQGVLAHEVMHIVEQHSTRQQGRDHFKFNIASDLEINPIIRESGLKLPSNVCIPGEGNFTGLKNDEIAETYYNQLSDNKMMKMLAMMNGQGAPGDPKDPGGCGGFLPTGQTEAERSKVAADWDVAVRQAAQVAKEAHKNRQAGNMPAYFEKLLERLLKPPKVPWTSELRQFFIETSRDDYTWSTPNRRYIASGLYLPSLFSQHLGEIVMFVDLSGSMMGGDDLARCATEMTAILECLPSKVTIAYHDTEVKNIQEWNRYDGPIKFIGKGGGGTDHRPCFKWLEEQDKNPAVVIFFTDLETSFPTNPPNYPVFWVTVHGGNAPFGRVLEI